MQFDTFLTKMVWTLRKNKVMDLFLYPSLNIAEALNVEEEHEASNLELTIKTIKNIGNQLKQNLGIPLAIKSKEKRGTNSKLRFLPTKSFSFLKAPYPGLLCRKSADL